MGMKKSSLSALAMMSIAAAMSADSYPSSNNPAKTGPTPEELEEKRKKQLDRLTEINNNKYGLKAFFYEEHIIYARNQKNADRKARNKGYI